MTKRQETKIQKALEQIAIQECGIETLTTRKSGHLDFHEVAVWELKAALEAAYRAGQDAATK